MKYAFLVLLFLSIPETIAQTLHTVMPAITDPGITGTGYNHHIYINTTVAGKNKLFLFFPGTAAVPYNYREILKEAANLGYHSIGLMYSNDEAINALCAGSSDTTCHSRARYEVFDGTDRTTDVAIDRSHSIENRAIKLLQYLITQYPTENWAQYLAGDSIVWNKIVVSGHSQGGGFAGFIGKIKEVDRVVMFCATDWIINLNRNADWITWSGKTPAAKYYGFIHESDEQIDFGILQTTWQKYGMFTYGPLVLADTAMHPYSHSHALYTKITPGNGATQFHGAPVVDYYTPYGNGVPVLKPVWDYLLGEVSVSSVAGIVRNEGESIDVVYPNPSGEFLNINAINDNFTWKIVDLLGNSILVGADQKHISLSDLPAGTYFLFLQSQGGLVIHKFIKY